MSVSYAVGCKKGKRRERGGIGNEGKKKATVIAKKIGLALARTAIKAENFTQKREEKKEREADERGRADCSTSKEKLYARYRPTPDLFVDVDGNQEREEFHQRRKKGGEDLSSTLRGLARISRVRGRGDSSKKKRYCCYRLSELGRKKRKGDLEREKNEAKSSQSMLTLRKKKQTSIPHLKEGGKKKRRNNSCNPS